jgi:hypothetical protein
LEDLYLDEEYSVAFLRLMIAESECINQMLGIPKVVKSGLIGDLVCSFNIINPVLFVFPKHEVTTSNMQHSDILI